MNRDLAREITKRMREEVEAGLIPEDMTMAEWLNNFDGYQAPFKFESDFSGGGEEE